VDGRSRFQAIAKPLLTRLPEGVYREAVMDGLRQHLTGEVLNALMADTPVAPRTPATTPAGGAKRRSVVQKVINLALHYPRAAARVADADRLAALTQPGTDLLRRVFAAASDIGDGSTARVLETLRDDPDFRHLERIVAEPPLGIESEDAAAMELKASLEHLGSDAARTAEGLRVRGHTPGPGPA
jgi:DNA primase